MGHGQVGLGTAGQRGGLGTAAHGGKVDGVRRTEIRPFWAKR